MLSASLCAEESSERLTKMKKKKGHRAMTITTIVFDLGEVLLNCLLGVEHSLEPLIGIKADKINAMLSGEGLRSLFHGEVIEEEYWSRMIRKHRWPVDVETLKREVRANFKEIEGTRAIIERLREKGYKIAGECLFIDDSQKNTVAARDLGIRTILFRNAGQLKKELAAYHVRV